MLRLRAAVFGGRLCHAIAQPPAALRARLQFSPVAQESGYRRSSHRPSQHARARHNTRRRGGLHRQPKRRRTGLFFSLARRLQDAGLRMVFCTSRCGGCGGRICFARVWLALLLRVRLQTVQALPSALFSRHGDAPCVASWSPVLLGAARCRKTRKTTRKVGPERCCSAAHSCPPPCCRAVT